ncbi:hypothetical protein BDW75DRAFT_106819 [Aspergillus navahoensis]
MSLPDNRKLKGFGSGARSAPDFQYVQSPAGLNWSLRKNQEPDLWVPDFLTPLDSLTHARSGFFSRAFSSAGLWPYGPVLSPSSGPRISESPIAACRSVDMPEVFFGLGVRGVMSSEARFPRWQQSFLAPQPTARCNTWSWFLTVSSNCRVRMRTAELALDNRASKATKPRQVLPSIPLRRYASEYILGRGRRISSALFNPIPVPAVLRRQR